MHLPILSSLPRPAFLGPRWRLVLGLVLPPVLAAAVLVGSLVYSAPPAPPGPPGPAAPPGAANAGAGNAEAGTSLPAPSGLLVEVSGAVAHPGVYRVAKGERTSAAIAAAGGLTADADPNRLPAMAARLKDGQRVRVPSLGAPAGSSRTTAPRVARVSLNAATEAQLAAVPGFTPELAAAVIQYRAEFGGFTTTRELVDVLAMGQADYSLARKYVTV
jgi:competence protein ComEA